MDFEEYKKIFDEILNLTDSIIENFQKNDFETAALLINKRVNLFSKVSSLPENITNEQAEIIQNLLTSFKEKNSFIKRFSAVQNNKIKLSKLDQDYIDQKETTISNKDNLNENNNSIFEN